MKWERVVKFPLHSSLHHRSSSWVFALIMWLSHNISNRKREINKNAQHAQSQQTRKLVEKNSKNKTFRTSMTNLCFPSLRDVRENVTWENWNSIAQNCFCLKVLWLLRRISTIVTKYFAMIIIYGFVDQFQGNMRHLPTLTKFQSKKHSCEKSYN